MPIQTPDLDLSLLNGQSSNLDNKAFLRAASRISCAYIQ
jgi:hypothetical protein